MRKSKFSILISLVSVLMLFSLTSWSASDAPVSTSDSAKNSQESNDMGLLEQTYAHKVIEAPYTHCVTQADNYTQFRTLDIYCTTYDPSKNPHLKAEFTVKFGNKTVSFYAEDHIESTNEGYYAYSFKLRHYTGFQGKKWNNSIFEITYALDSKLIQDGFSPCRSSRIPSSPNNPDTLSDDSCKVSEANDTSWTYFERLPQEENRSQSRVLPNDNTPELESN
ncbi:MAG: hypothetical protein HOO06_11565 [Bdellovibrionaceae bacterium]|jgi:hypothetical protein|nr:hypothetical protein [Pseudobdellovibrionaceae bacterium]